MKKLLVVGLVMLMASMANAVIIELSVDGQLTPGQAVVELEPSDTFVIDIYDSQGYTQLGQDGYVIAMSDMAVSSISGGIILPDHLDSVILGGNQELADLGFVGKTGVLAFLGSSAGSGTPTWAPGKVVDEILFHCDVYPGDTVIELLWTADFTEWTVVDSIMVHQIPEPMTMSLLGLGALLIRRK
jgi:hypothetical protein